MSDLRVSEGTAESVLNRLRECVTQEDLWRTMGELKTGGTEAATVERGLALFAAESRAELEELEREKSALEARLPMMRRLADALEGWLGTGKGESRLEVVPHTRFHRLQEAVEKKKAWFASGGEPFWLDSKVGSTGVFVIQHDWEAAVGSAIDEALGERSVESALSGDWRVLSADEESLGAFRLPFDACVFEFQVDGRCVCLVASQSENTPAKAMACVEFGEEWMCLRASELEDAYRFRWLWRQVFSVCVALEAGLAGFQTTEPSVALNKKRQRAGKPVVRPFHTVRLLRATSARSVAADSTGGGSRRRLHLRRGHWRHYEKYRRWIKWMLVGEPDLGFLEKTYRI